MSKPAVHDLGRGGVCRAAAQAVSRVLEPVFDVLFPPRCVGCGDFESYLCARCRESLEVVGPGCCPRCGEPGPVGVVSGRCSACMGEEFSFFTARASYVHAGVARRLVLEFKLGGQPVLGRIMAELARPAFVDVVSSLGVSGNVAATWVPCHSKTRRERGYDQAEMLCRLLCHDRAGDNRHIACSPVALVRKTKLTKEQKGLDRAGRRNNLRGVFVMEEGWRSRLPVGVKALVLVDDVFTTGATVEEVSRVLGFATGLPVHVFTFSRARAIHREGHD